MCQAEAKTVCKPAHWAEELAQRTLAKRGWRCLAANYRTRFGEFDLLCHTGTHLALIEVKQRAQSTYGFAAEMISKRQLARMMRTFEHYLLHHPEHRHLPVQIDAFLVAGTPTAHTVEHLENITA